MPKAGSSRPSDSTSMVAHCLASSTGSRIASDTTFMPKLIRRVRPASAAIVVMHSRIGVRLTSRSVCQIESTPPCLAQIDPAPVVAGPGEREFHQADADGDAHACALASGAILSR